MSTHEPEIIVSTLEEVLRSEPPLHFMRKLNRMRQRDYDASAPHPWPLVNAISALIFKHDPIQIAFTLNTDEYNDEAVDIANALQSCDSASSVTEMVHETFIRCFNAAAAGERSRYEAIGEEIWQIYAINDRP